MAGQPPAVLLKALEVSARALDENLFNNFDHVLATGELFLKLLDHTYQINTSSTPDEKKIWTKIKIRLEEIFTPGLIKWDELRKKSLNWRSSDRRLTLGGRLSKSAVALSLKAQNSSQNLNETYCVSNSQEESDSSYDLHNGDEFAVGLLSIFVCCVFDQNQDVYGALNKLDDCKQKRIRSVFQYLIENRPGITQNKLELLLKSLSDDWQGNPIFNSTRSSLSPSITNSDITAKMFPKLPGGSDSFSYSPDGKNGTPKTSTDSPLQDFMRSQTTNQIVKYQKIVDEQTRKIRDTHVELDQEKTETLFLRKEVEKLQLERDRLKRSLENSRQNLLRQADLSFNESTASSDDGKLGELEKKDALLRMSMADKKDLDKYVKKLEFQVREVSEQNQELNARLEAQKDNLAESSRNNGKFVAQIIEFQESISTLSSENDKIKEENTELAAQVTQLGDILREKRYESGKKIRANGKDINPSLDVSVNDISMDEPQGYNSAMSPSMSFKSSVPSMLDGEKIGDTVVLELKKDIEKLSEENKHLNEINLASAKKCDDLVIGLKNQEEKHEIVIKEKETQFKERLHKLKTEFSMQLVEVDALEKSLSDKKRELEASKRQKAELEGTNQKLKTEHSEILQVKDSLMNAVNVLEKTNSEQKCKIEDCQNIIKDKAMTIHIITEKLDRSKCEIKGITNNCDDLKSELLEMKESNLKLHSEKSDLNEALLKKEENVSILQQEIDENKKYNSEMLLKYDKDIADIKSELEARSKECEELKSISNSMQTDLDQKESINDEYASVNAKLHNDIKQLKEEKLDMERQITSLNQENMLAIEQLNTKFAEKIGKLENSLKEKEAKEEFCQNELSEMKQVNCALTEQNNAFLNDQLQLEKEKEDLSKIIRDQTSKIKEHETALTTISKEFNDEKIDMQALITKISDDLSESKKREEDFHVQIKETGENIKAICQDKNELEVKNKELQNKINLLQDKEKALSNENLCLLKEADEKLCSQKEHYVSEIQLLTTDIEDRNKKQLIQENELNELKIVLEKTKKQYHAALEDEKNQKMTLQQNEELIRKTQDMYQETRKLLTIKEGELETTKNNLSESLKENAEIIEKHEKLNEKLTLQNDELQEDLKRSAAIHNKISSEKLEMKRLLDQYQLDKDSTHEKHEERMEQERKKYDAGSKSMQLEIEKLQNDLAERMQNINVYENEIQNIKEKLLNEAKLKEEYITKLTDLKETTDRNIKDLQSSLKEKDVYVDEKNKQFLTQEVNYKEKIGDLTKSFADKCKELQFYEKEVKDLNEKVGQFEETLSISKQANIVAEEKYVELAKNIESKENEISKQKELLSSQAAEIVSLTSKYESAVDISSSELAECRKQITELTDNINVLKAESKDASLANDERTKELEGLQLAVQSYKKENESLILENSKLVSESDKKLALQKEKFEGKLKNIADLAKKQYKENLEKGLSQLNRSIESRDKTIEENKVKIEALENQKVQVKTISAKYETAKIKLKELLELLEQERKERALAEEKYQASKDTIKTIQDQNRHMKNELKNTASKSMNLDLQNENESLKHQMKQLVSENRSLKVQVTHATTQIRGLQSDNHQIAGGTLDRRQTLNSIQARSSKSNGETYKDVTKDVFKMPSERRAISAAQNTPGRAKAGRTQSEATLARRPPTGSGPMFLMDDEAGEMFSNSYLLDMKDGKCNPFGNISANASGYDRRLSELSRRNTMVPAHLKSSYPAETQFFNLKEFDDKDLQHGRLTNIMPSDKRSVDVNDITDKAANLSVDSPAMNTRNKRNPVAFTVTLDNNTSKDEDGPSTPALTLAEALNDKVVNAALEENKHVNKKGVKRRSSGAVVTNHTTILNDSIESGKGLNKSASSTTGSKRLKKDQHSVSYSRPGPPTPARHKGNKSMSSNTSFESATEHNMSNVSNQNCSTWSNHPKNLVSGANDYNTPILKGKKRGDKTPLLDTTNQSSRQASVRSNRSIKSFGKATPMSLKKVMTRAFGRKKLEKKKVGGDAVTRGDKTVVITPKKRLKL